MTEIIRIPNIEKYTQEIINGELILVSDHKKSKWNILILRWFKCPKV